MSDRRYYRDYYADLPTELDEDEYAEYDGENDMYHLNHERAVRVAIRNIRNSLKFLAEETDVVYSFHNGSMEFNTESLVEIDTIREDEY